MRGPRVAMRHNKDATYGTLDNALDSIERMAPLAAGLAGQGMANQQALDVIEAQRPRPTPRPATQPVTITEFTPLPLPGDFRASSTVETR